MKPIAKPKATQPTLSLTQSQDMRIDQNALDQILTILTNQYENPYSAVIREYTSNAFDAIVNQPNGHVTLTFPRDQKLLSIEDNGVGLTAQDLNQMFNQYGFSTKRETNEQIGGFGIGAKSALTITDNFSVTSYKDGQETTIQIKIDENNHGTTAILPPIPTDHPNGTIVNIPLQDESLNKINYLVHNHVDLLLNDILFGFNQDQLTVKDDQGNNLIKAPLFSKEANVIQISDHVYFRADPKSARATNLKIGSVAYQSGLINKFYHEQDEDVATNNPLQNLMRTQANSYQSDLFVDFPIGLLQLTPSREKIVDSQENLNKIKTFFQKEYKQFQQNPAVVLEQINHLNIKDPYQFLQVLETLNILFENQHTISADTPLKYQDLDLKDYVDLDLTDFKFDPKSIHPAEDHTTLKPIPPTQVNFLSTRHTSPDATIYPFDGNYNQIYDQFVPKRILIYNVDQTRTYSKIYRNRKTLVENELIKKDYNQYPYIDITSRPNNALFEKLYDTTLDFNDIKDLIQKPKKNNQVELTEDQFKVKFFQYQPQETIYYSTYKDEIALNYQKDMDVTDLDQLSQFKTDDPKQNLVFYLDLPGHNHPYFEQWLKSLNRINTKKQIKTLIINWHFLKTGQLQRQFQNVYLIRLQDLNVDQQEAVKNQFTNLNDVLSDTNLKIIQDRFQTVIDLQTSNQQIQQFQNTLNVDKDYLQRGLDITKLDLESNHPFIQRVNQINNNTQNVPDFKHNIRFFQNFIDDLQEETEIDTIKNLDEKLSPQFSQTAQEIQNLFDDYPALEKITYHQIQDDFRFFIQNYIESQTQKINQNPSERRTKN